MRKREERGKQNTDKRKGTAQNSAARKKPSALGRSRRADRPSGLPRRSAPSHEKLKGMYVRSFDIKKNTMKSWRNRFSGCRNAQARRKAIRTFKSRLRTFLSIFQHKRKQLRQEGASTLLGYFPKQKNSDCGLAPSQNFRPRRPAARKRKQTDGYHTKILGDHFRRATHLTKLIHPAAKTRRRSAPSLPNLGNAIRQKRKENRRKTKGPAPLSAPTPKRSEGLGRAQIFQIVFKNKQKGV